MGMDKYGCLDHTLSFHTYQWTREKNNCYIIQALAVGILFLPCSVCLKHSWEERMDVGTSADHQQNNHQQTLKVEDGRLETNTVNTEIHTKTLHQYGTYHFCDQLPLQLPLQLQQQAGVNLVTKELILEATPT